MSRNVRRVALFLLLFLVLVTGMAAGSSGPGRIVFVSVRDTYSDIYVMNADGSGQTRLTNSQGFVWGPQWSPDGTKIAFDAPWNNNSDIYVMNADGKRADPAHE